MNDNSTARKWSRSLAALFLLVVGAVIFRDFLFGEAVLLYKDAGSDSVNDYYPWFIHLSDYVRTQGFPSWSFYVGMGQDIFFYAGYLILEPVTWLPKELIGPTLIFQHLLKVLIAGFLFLRFLQLLRLSAVAALLGSLLLSFSAYMCMGGCWYPLADQVLCFTALLLATEEAVARGRWFFLPLAVALVGLIDSFHLYLCALFLVLYVPPRLYALHGWQPRRIFGRSLALAAVATLGAGLGAIVTIPNLYALSNSPRGSGATSMVATLSSLPVFRFESPVHYITAALRLFANDMLGTAENFRGWGNYLEAPLTYCGLICLVIFPQVFVRAPRRQKVIYTLFVAGILLSSVFPWFRHLFWLFQGDYYRTLSLFSILGIITLSTVALSRYIEGRLNLWLLAATAIIAVGTLYLPLDELQSRIDPNLKLQATIFLATYTVLLAVGHLIKRPQVLAVLIVAIAAGELVLFDRITVSNRSTVTKTELKTRVGYNDETIDALADIKTSDNSSFFRITKIRASGPGVLPSLNDAMAFGYYGTSSYSSFNNINYINFLTAVDAIPPNSEMHTRWSVGLLNDSILSLFAGEKYALVEDPMPFQRAVQYEFVKQYEKDYLFRNARFLPLGLAFDRYITEEDFLRVPAGEKSGVLLQAAVLSNKGEAEKQGLMPANLSDLEQEARNLVLADVVAARRKMTLDLASFSQTRLGGKVLLGQKSILVLQTPFDRGWSAFQDGQAAPVLKVDIGLLGVALDAGEHKVEVRYKTPFLDLALGVSLVSLLILIVSALRWPRLNLSE